MKTIEEDVIWGKSSTRGEHSEFFDCLNCGDQSSQLLYPFSKKFFCALVGVQKSREPRQDLIYDLIFQCPKCDYIYWYHTNEIIAKERKKIINSNLITKISFIWARGESNPLLPLWRRPYYQCTTHPIKFLSVGYL